MIQVRIIPLRRGRCAAGFEEAGEISIPYLVDGYFEPVHPDAMYGLLLVAPLLAAHMKIPRGDRGADRLFHTQLATPSRAPQWKPAPNAADTTATPAPNPSRRPHYRAAISSAAHDPVPSRRRYAWA